MVNESYMEHRRKRGVKDDPKAFGLTKEVSEGASHLLRWENLKEGWAGK